MQNDVGGIRRYQAGREYLFHVSVHPLELLLEYDNNEVLMKRRCSQLKAQFMQLRKESLGLLRL